MAAPLGCRTRVRGRRRSEALEVLLPGDVRVPIWPRSCRPCSQLHHRRRAGAYQADARLQRAASVRLGCVRAAGGERRHQNRHAAGEIDAREHRPYERAAAAARDQLRVGARDRDVPAELLQVQSVDLPEDARARPRIPPPLDGELVSELPDRARERAGHRRHVLALRIDGRYPRAGAVVLPHHRVRRRPAEGARYADGMAREGRRDAAELDRAFGRGAREVSARVPGRTTRLPRRSLHDAHRHDLRRQFHRARARASARGAARCRGCRSGRLSCEGQGFRTQDRDVRMGGKEGFDTGRRAINPFTNRARSHLGRELRAR